VHAEWRVGSPPAGAPPATAADAGAPNALVLAVDLSDGWHVNAHDPDRPYLIPTELIVEPPPGATVEAI